MGKEILQITIKPQKKPKTKFGRWWKDNISFPIYLKKLEFKAWFWGCLYNFAKWVVPDSKHDEVFGVDEDFEVHLDFSGDEEIEENMKEAIIKEVEKNRNDNVDEAVKKTINDLNKGIS